MSSTVQGTAGGTAVTKEIKLLPCWSLSSRGDQIVSRLKGRVQTVHHLGLHSLEEEVVISSHCFFRAIILELYEGTVFYILFKAKGIQVTQVEHGGDG